MTTGDSADNRECKKEIIETHSAEETFALGQRIGREALPGQVYTLIGDLGVGKTVFTQGVADGLGITEPVNSPTFTIVQIYEEGRMPFYHFDVYRIGDVEEMEEIGYEDCFYGEGLCLIEWANLIEEILPEERTEILIEKDLEQGFDEHESLWKKGWGKEGGTVEGAPPFLERFPLPSPIFSPTFPQTSRPACRRHPRARPQ